MRTLCLPSGQRDVCPVFPHVLHSPSPLQARLQPCYLVRQFFWPFGQCGVSAMLKVLLDAHRHMAALPRRSAPPPGTAWCLCRMLEVTGGSMSTSFKSSGHDFPTLYQVRGFGLGRSIGVLRLSHACASQRCFEPHCR